MLKTGLAAGATLAVPSISAATNEIGTPQKGAFKLKYGPHFGMFENHAGKDPVDQLKFAADEGFRGWEENGMKGFSVGDQERIAKAMTDLKITMGVFVANGSTAWGNGIPAGKKEDHEKFVAECKESVEVAKRVNAKWMTVVPGSVELRMDLGYQTANVIDLLRRGAEIFEPHGLIMVLEPLNFRDHPNMLLTRVSQAFEICRAVNSPSCKILNDMYHTQIHEGNIIPNIDRGWSEIAAFQIGDNPGRNEPGTGEMNYRNIFRHIHSKGFQGVLGMEHGISRGGKEGERALIDAYRAADNF
ncbi:MAG: TIM barrel protein [Fimbriimonadaceae bacterium]